METNKCLDAKKRDSKNSGESIQETQIKTINAGGSFALEDADYQSARHQVKAWRRQWENIQETKRRALMNSQTHVPGWGAHARWNSSLCHSIEGPEPLMYKYAL